MDIEKIISALQMEGIQSRCRLYFIRKKNNNSYISYSPLIEEGGGRAADRISAELSRKTKKITNYRI